ncbi:MAG: TonB-dependent receptor [Verrucomicrobiota bacterium]|nr:TonB-dependent receptor [Verrucomicrobiota bacterium]
MIHYKKGGALWPALYLMTIIGLAPQVALAENQELEEVVVTGSFIKGTPEDAALPVDVLTRSDLEDVGNPTLLEMVRNLGVTSGNLGETNQFDTRGGQASEGTTAINLRGLGPSRTLVLINSKRHVATETIGVDISAIPSIAIGRVEVLKDGAAALYGSDAIGGVVNFITRDSFEGFEISGSFTDLEDSDGDTSIAAIFGRRSGALHYAISAEYEERSELRIRDRDWALRPFAENPGPGGWSAIGNPGAFLPGISNGAGGRTLLGGFTPDPGCDLLGGTTTGGFCRFQYTFFDNLIEDQETYKVFAEVNYDITDSISFHAEALYHDMDIPEWDTSPSYPPQALLGNDRFIEASHPGLIDLKAQNPGLFNEVAGIPASAQGASSWSRMLGVAGRNGQPESSYRKTKTKRISFGLVGETDSGISFDTSFSWSKRERNIGGSDMFIERMAFAFDGLGGSGCNQATGSAGVGSCEYYNPFSNALSFSPVTGATNPQYNASVANSDELINWLTAETGSKTDNESLVFEAILSGASGWELGGGSVGWAAGLQYRKDTYDFSVRDVANRAINPCPFNNPVSVSLGHTVSLDCGAGGAGQLAFLAATDEENTDRDIYGVFAELALPITDALDVQLAVRYEDYGSKNGGDTIDPKIAFSWTLTDEFSLRGSVSTTFRGPPSSALSGTSTALQYIPTAVAFKAADTVGNADLEPETAVATNFGAIYQNDNFYASLDYWSFSFEDPLQTENATQIVAAYDANGCADGGAGVGSSACDLLRGRLSPIGTSSAGVERITRFVINGSDIDTSGVDFVANYSFNDVAGGLLTLGLEGSYTLEYESDDFVTADGFVLAQGDDFVGRLNEGTPFQPKPELKASFIAKWSNDAHRVTYAARFVDGMDDENSPVAALDEIDDHTTHDVHYINNMFDDVTISLSVFNFTDEDPPQVANDLNYDPYNHSGFGRMIKLGVRYSM